MSTSRRVFPETFKRDAVGRVALRGLPIAKVAGELGLSRLSPPRWRWGSPIVARTLVRLGLDIMVDHHSCIAGPSVAMTRASPARCEDTTRTRQASRTRQSAQYCIFVMEI